MDATGPATVTPGQATAWLRKRGAHERLVAVVGHYFELAPIVGLRPEVVIAQAAHETGFGHYGGVVPPEFNNFAGIKTAAGGPDSDPAAHERFVDPRDGVRGHVNHGEAYVRAREPIGTPHGRYWTVRSTSWAGSCRTTQDIGRRWSSANSTAYGDKLDTLVREMEATVGVVNGKVEGFTFKDLGPDGGIFAEHDDPKLELHSTEGTSLAGAESAFKACPPHFGVSVDECLWRQYVVVDRYAYANKSNDSARIYQVEIVGFAKDMRTKPDGWLRTLGEKLWLILDAVGIPLNVVRHGFHDTTTYTGSKPLASEGSSIRLTSAELYAFSGILGHQHMPAPDCVAPDTPILCADLTWRSAGDLQVGDEVIGVDEYTTDDVRAGRKLRTSTVERNWIGLKHCARVVTDHGDVVASLDHPWLAYDLRLHRGSRYRWITTAELAEDPSRWQIATFGEPWHIDTSWGAGWLAGLFDADGSLMVNNRPGHGFVTLAFSQRPGPLADRFMLEMEDRGFRVSVADRNEWKATLGNGPCLDVRVKGGKLEVMRVLGTLRPQRLLAHERLAQLWEGNSLGKATQGGRAAVLAVEPVGERDVASLSTSTRTYIANGLVCHNSHWDPGALKVLRALELARPGSVPTTPPIIDTEDEEMNRYGAWLFETVRWFYDQYASRPADTGGLHNWVGEFRKDSYYPSFLGGAFNTDAARDVFVNTLKYVGEYRPR